MTITQLKYVLAVAEHKNFTLAAKKCFVTHPTLSMQIQKIEEELSIQIFDRTKKPIQLTDIGQKIVNQAKNIVNEADRIQDIVEQQKGFIGGESQSEKIKEIVLYFEPFVAYIPESHHNFQKEEIEVSDLNLDEILLLQDGHCFRDGILNLCKNNPKNEFNHFQIESGSFETLIKRADEGLGTPH